MRIRSKGALTERKNLHIILLILIISISSTFNTYSQDCQLPEISIQPKDTGISCISNNISFKVHSNNAITYQWYKDNNPITDATNNKYIIDSCTFNELGNYKCIVGNNCGFIESREAHLLLNPLNCPNIIFQPFGDTINCGDMYSLKMIIAGNNKYQWYKNGEIIEGANSNEYSIQAISPESGGEFYCISVSENKCCPEERSDVVNVFVINNCKIGKTPEEKYKERINFSELMISPNPSNGFVKVSFPDNYSADNIHIIDITGKEVFSQNISKEKEKELNLFNLKKGMYIVKYGEKYRKLIIEN